MKPILACHLDEILIRLDTRRLQRLARDLLVFSGDEVHAEGELGDGGALLADFENADLGVGDAAVVAGFGEGFV